MSSESKSKKANKNLKALFSVICISIIAMGVIVYASSNRASNDAVNEPTTVEETTEADAAVQRSVTIEATTEVQTEVQTEAQTAAAEPTTEKENTSMALTDTNTPYKSFYKYPIDEAVIGGYTQELVKNETMGDYRSHTAVDFRGEPGCEITAINDGIVLEVENDAIYGMTVTIDHGGQLAAKYCGLDVVNVTVGAPVVIGEVIGTLGKVPFESKSDPHLHFETRLDGESVNPLDVMGKTE